MELFQDMKEIKAISVIMSIKQFTVRFVTVGAMAHIEKF